MIEGPPTLEEVHSKAERYLVEHPPSPRRWSLVWTAFTVLALVYTAVNWEWTTTLELRIASVLGVAQVLLGVWRTVVWTRRWRRQSRRVNNLMKEHN